MVHQCPGDGCAVCAWVKSHPKRRKIAWEFRGKQAAKQSGMTKKNAQECDRVEPAAKGGASAAAFNTGGIGSHV